MYITFTKNGALVVQDPDNRRHKFLAPSKSQPEFETMGELFDYLEDRYRFVPWITEEGAVINLKDDGL